jgi:hypothetical protein
MPDNRIMHTIPLVDYEALVLVWHRAKAVCKQWEPMVPGTVELTDALVEALDALCEARQEDA